MKDLYSTSTVLPLTPPALTERRWPVEQMLARVRRSQSWRTTWPSRVGSVTGHHRSVKALRPASRAADMYLLCNDIWLGMQPKSELEILVHEYFIVCGLDKGTIIETYALQAGKVVYVNRKLGQVLIEN